MTPRQILKSMLEQVKAHQPALANEVFGAQPGPAPEPTPEPAPEPDPEPEPPAPTPTPDPSPAIPPGTTVVNWKSTGWWTTEWPQGGHTVHFKVPARSTIAVKFDARRPANSGRIRVDPDSARPTPGQITMALSPTPDIANAIANSHSTINWDRAGGVFKTLMPETIMYLILKNPHGTDGNWIITQQHN